MAAWSRHKWLACTGPGELHLRDRARGHGESHPRSSIRDHQHMNRWMVGCLPYEASSAAGLPPPLSFVAEVDRSRRRRRTSVPMLGLACRGPSFLASRRAQASVKSAKRLQ